MGTRSASAGTRDSGHGGLRTLAALAVVLACALAICFVMSGQVLAKDGTLEGSGTEADPYLIEDAADLATVSSLVNDSSTYETYGSAHYKLTGDIDMSTSGSFTPIGSGSSYYFTGTIDGDGYAISGISISGDRYVAFVGYAQDATIENLTISGSVNASGTYAAGFVGRVKGGITILNCGNEADVTSAGIAAAGLVAYVASGSDVTIDSCYNSGDITSNASSSSNSYTGGIIGLCYSPSESTTVSNCYNSGTITANGGYGAAGIVATLNTSTTDGRPMTVENCYNVGTVQLVDNEATASSTVDAYGAIYAYDQTTSSTNSDQNNVVNCYWLDSSCDQGYKSYKSITVSDCSAKSSNEMMTADFVTLLNGEDGTAWVQTSTYPVLSWESGDGAPLIVTDLSTDAVDYNQGYDAESLEVAASLPSSGMLGSDGVLSYQWYSSASGSTDDGVAIEGATSSSYVPSTEEGGATYYYCVVTNTWTADDGSSTSMSSTSSLAYVVIHSGSIAATPTIAELATTVYEVQQDSELSIAIEASVSGDGAGELSYQWYQCDADGSNAAAIEGATGSSLIVDTSTLGTYYYYCTVTNTYEMTLTSSADSGVISVTVSVAEISTAADLKALADRVDGGDNCEGKSFVITADIDLQSDESTQDWDPIGSGMAEETSFAGTIDGQGHTISGLDVDSEEGYAGLFATLNDATVSNLAIEGDVTGSSYVAALAGYVIGTETTISNVGVDVDVVATDGYAGGLIGGSVGTNRAMSIDRCYSRGSVSGTQLVGGFIGYSTAEATITNCYSTADVSCTGNYAGGFIAVGGNSESAYENCYAAGDIDGTNYSGMFVGSFISAPGVSNCYAVSSADYGIYGYDSDTTFSGLTSLESSAMLDPSFVTTLGDAYEEDVPLVNGGYPILDWELADGMPVISNIVSDPEEASVSIGGSVTIAVTAAAPNDGTSSTGLSYQWYRNSSGERDVDSSEAVEGATSAVLEVPTTSSDVGTSYYFCVVTNTLADGQTASASSECLAVTVTSDVEAAIPVLTTSGESVTCSPIDPATISVSVDSYVDSNGEATEYGIGELSYQWYAADEATTDVDAATAIEGATSAEYSPEIASVGTSYYFCVVTNTFESVKAESTTSSSIAVEVGDMEIWTADDLMSFADYVNAGNDCDGMTARLMSDIDMTDVDFEPIADGKSTPFCGTFEGDGYSISGIDYVNASDDYRGLFGYTEGATIRNLAVSSDMTCGGLYTGGIVGYADATTIEDVSFSGYVSSTYEYIGGIAGYATNGTRISYAVNDAEVYADVYVGGIAGMLTQSSTVDHSVNSGKVWGSGTAIGGIAGKIMYAGSGVENCANTGYVESDSTSTSAGGAMAGGIVGCLQYGSSSAASYVIGCYSTGGVTATATTTGGVGGIVGYAYNSSQYLTEIADCYSSGAVTYDSSTSKHGSIVGCLYISNSTALGCLTVDNCYAVGSCTDDSGTVYGDTQLAPTTGFAYETAESQIVTLDQMLGVEAFTSGGDADVYVIDLLNAGSNGISYSADTDSANGLVTVNNDGLPLLSWQVFSVTLSADSFFYDGSEVIDFPTVTVSAYDGTVLEEDVGYTLSYIGPDGEEMTSMVVDGTCYAVATGMGDYEGIVMVASFDVETDVDLSDAKLDVSDAIYSGEPVTGNVTVTLADGTALVEGTDYTVAYYDADGNAVEEVVEIGTYTVVISGEGIVEGTADAEFEILSQYQVIDLFEEVVEAASSITGIAISEDGSDVAPDSQWVTQEAIDALSAAIEAAEEAAASGDQQAMQDAGEAIEAAIAEFEAAVSYGTMTDDLGGASVEASGLVYSGEPLELPEAVVTYNGNTLIEGDDYTLAYYDANGNAVEFIERPGTYTVVATGTGSYTGTASATFEVTESIEGATASAEDLVYTGSALEPSVAVTLADGTVLVEGTDYTVAYYDADGNAVEEVVEIGAYTASIEGAGCYFGSAEASFEVVSEYTAEDVSGLASDAAALAEDVIASEDGSDVAPDSQWVTQEAIDSLSAAIEAAEEAAASGDQQAMQDAGEAIEAAIAEFEAAVSYGTMGDSSSDETTSSSAGWKRLGGDDRYETNSLAVSKGFETADAVIVASGETAADALAASGLAGILDAPVVLTDYDKLVDEAVETISSLGASTVYVMGGESAISSDVFGSIEAIDGVDTVERIYGGEDTGRVETALAVYAKGSGSWGSTAIVVNGSRTADALSASAYAYSMELPIFMADGDGTLSDGVVAAIQDGGFDRILIVGGTAVVDESVDDQLAEITGVTPERIAGETRYGTSLAMAKVSIADGMTLANAVVACGSDSAFADALSASALAGSTDSVLMLAEESDGGYEATDGILTGNALEVQQGYFLGGKAVFSGDFYEYLNTIE